MEDCIFCAIANGDIPSDTVYEDDDFKVILDLNPASKGHALILPKKHCRDITQADETVLGKAMKLASNLGKAMIKGLACDGFNVVMNTGAAAGQTVFHFHIHVIPRYKGEENIVCWVPGTSEPESQKKLAEIIRKSMQL